MGKSVLQDRRIRAIQRKWRTAYWLLALLSSFWHTAGPWQSASSDQQQLTQPKAYGSQPSHVLRPDTWHASTNARIIHAGLQVSAFQHHWADPKPYRRRPKHYLAEPHVETVCAADSILVVSLLYLLLAAPLLAWIATSNQHTLKCLAIASFAYFLAQQQLKHPLQQSSRDQSSSFITAFHSYALPAHQALYAVTCLTWASIDYPAPMWQLLRMIGWLCCYRCSSFIAAKYLADVPGSAVLSSKWFCRLASCCRTVAIILIVTVNAWSGYASAKLIALLLIIAGVEQNPGPTKRAEQSQQGK